MIYVDPLVEYPIGTVAPAARRYGNKWCHMMSDISRVELQAFAFRLGLGRASFQTAGRPHYDLVPSKRALAVKLGAEEVTTREIFERCQEVK